MDWSKVKQRAEERFASSLRGRMTLHLTRYRKSSHDHLYELWLSLDGEKLVGVSDGEFYEAYYKALVKAGHKSDVSSQTEAGSPSGRLSKQLIEESLNLSVESLIAHESPVLRALGILDARFGERRLRKIDIISEHPLVASVVRVRCHAEGIRLAEQVRTDEQLST
jgi:hypothetical protein